MAAQILSELSVGLTSEIHDALETATAFSGVKPSVYGRIALVEKLTREQFLQHPGVAHLEKRAAPAGIKSPAA